MVPGIVYGGAAGNVAVTLDPKDILRLLRSDSGRNTILTLNIDGVGTDNVILKDWQVDPVKETILHADFQRIAMDRALRVTVHIAVRGEAAGVKTEGGLLDVVLREVDVECLPADIPERIECDVTDLHMNQSIRVRDLPRLERVEILEDPDRVVVHVVSVREEAAAPAEAVEVPAEGGEPELIAKGKKEEEEGG
jgi:large subunit ribosomal protein L25